MDFKTDGCKSGLPRLNALLIATLTASLKRMP